jgi:pimeloyl-ACP methyl ester carboxylesterase
MPDGTRRKAASPFESITTQPEFTTTFVSRKSAVSEGVLLHYVTGGLGTPVILLHGFPQSWYMWRKIMLPLADEYTVIAPDLRGAGDSEKTVGPFDAWTLAGDIHALMGLLGHEKAVVVGHDMGAPVALSFAARYPEASHALVYIDEPVFGVDLETRAAFSSDNPNMVWWWPFQHQPFLAETLLQGHERAYFDHFVFSKTHVTNHWAMSEVDKQEYVRHLSEVGGLTGALGGYRDVFISEQHLAPFKANKIDVPTLGMNGEFALKGTAEALRSYMTSVLESIIPNSGHFIAEEQPPQLLDTLRGFFESLKL